MKTYQLFKRNYFVNFNWLNLVVLSFMLLIVSSSYSISAAGNKDDLSAKEYLKRIKANYENLNSLAIQMQYKLYKGHTATAPANAYNAIYYKSDVSSYRKIDNTELISNQNLSLKINHDQRAILISNPSSFTAIEADLETTISFCHDIKVVKNKKSTLIQMMIRDKTDLPYSRVDIIIDENFWIKNLILYYSTQLDFSETYSNKDMAFPKLEIIYDVFADNWKDKNGLVDITNYVVPNNDGFKPAEKYKDYEILDYRINH